MSWLDFFSSLLPDIRAPIKRLSFNDKLKWTFLVLLAYFLMANIPLFGLSPRAIDYFASMRAIIAGRFGSLLTLGIGPIVTAGLILELLIGAEVIKIDMQSPEGRKLFEKWQRAFLIFVTLFEASAYVLTGGLPAEPNTAGTKLFLIFQLAFATFLIYLLDQVSTKWGFISGISLFIAAGVSDAIITGIFNPLPDPYNPMVKAGRLWASIHYLVEGDPEAAFGLFLPILTTLLVVVVTTYAQGIKVEIPLSFARVRGAITRWPLSLFYTSNIPVIFTAALLANIQLWLRMLGARLHIPWIAQFDAQGNAVGGLIMLFIPPRELFTLLVFNLPGFIHGVITGGPYRLLLIRAIFYTLFMVLGSVFFARFWVYTANLDAKSVARQLQRSQLGIPGFRRDPRILEKILERYIPYLTDLGAVAVGLLAAFADFTHTLASGTGILLTVMILYRLYEVIVTQHLMDMHPALRELIKGEEA